VQIRIHIRAVNQIDKVQKNEMKRLNEFCLLFLTIITTSFSTLFCLIGFLTPGWYFDEYKNLFCDQCPRTPTTLVILSIILLIICLILLILLVGGIIEQQQITAMRFIIPTLLFLSTIFLLATFTSYLHFIQPIRGYSYNLIIIAFIFAYLSSFLGVFWLGNGGFISKSYTIDSLAENR